MTACEIVSVRIEIKTLIMCGYSIRDIAERLGLPYSTVHRLIHEARDLEALFNNRRGLRSAKC